MPEKIRVNQKDCTADTEGQLYFLKGKYADGHILAFYSHSPCGHVRDQERGWVLISPERTIADEVETFCYGPTGEGRRILKRWREEHGKLKYYVDELGEHRWKMTEC